MIAFERHYYRCASCLEVFATEGARQSIDLACDCGGTTIYMGCVERDRLVTQHLESACDHRCTSARGPSCNCKCGGLNHGSGRCVEIRTDCGLAPTIHAPRTLAARLAVKAEFEAAKEAARARVESRHATTLAAMRARQWVSDKAAWWAAKDAQDQLRKASTYLMQGKRLSELAKVAAQ